MKWRILLYELLTQLIIWLGKARTRLTERRGALTMQRRFDRTFYVSNCERAECCDCGLIHLHYPLHKEPTRERHFRMVPLRPSDYKYKLRAACDPASPSVNESHLDPWTGEVRNG